MGIVSFHFAARHLFSSNVGPQAENAQVVMCMPQARLRDPFARCSWGYVLTYIGARVCVYVCVRACIRYVCASAAASIAAAAEVARPNLYERE